MSVQQLALAEEAPAEQWLFAPAAVRRAGSDVGVYHVRVGRQGVERKQLLPMVIDQYPKGDAVIGLAQLSGQS